MLIEFAVGLALVAAAVGVHVSSHMWVDLPCRVLLAILSIPILRDAIDVRRESLVY